MNLVVIYGPIAVGKTTIGAHLAELTGYKLLHNHLTIEPLLQIFDYDSPEFRRLNESFRSQIVKEAIAAHVNGLIMTFVWDLDASEDRQTLEQWTGPVAEAGGTITYVELSAPQSVRLDREGGADRVALKPSKQDIHRARATLIALDRTARLNSIAGEEPAPAVLRIDTASVDAAKAAALIADRLR